MHKLPTGSFEMAPLSEFVVTERKPQLPKIYFYDWLDAQPTYVGCHYKKYLQYDNNGNCIERGILEVYATKPTDVEVEMEDYDIVWD